MVVGTIILGVEQAQRVIIDGLVRSSTKILQSLISALFEPKLQTIQLIVNIPIESQIPLRKILFDCISLVFNLGRIPRFDGLDGSFVGELKSAPKLLHEISSLDIHVGNVESKYSHTCLLFSKFQHLLSLHNKGHYHAQCKKSGVEEKTDGTHLDIAGMIEDPSLFQHQIDDITSEINVGCFHIDARPLITSFGICLSEQALCAAP